jgi:three-Cys-motif partner protein
VSSSRSWISECATSDAIARRLRAPARARAVGCPAARRLAPLRSLRRAARIRGIQRLGEVSRDDGLVVRGVKPHSAQKSALVSRGIDTVSSAMSGKWFAVKHGIEYVELYSGPGRLLDESTGVEQPGSPMVALSVRKPFTHYVLSDFSQGCVDALSERVGTRPDVDVVCGDANDPDHLERVASLINARALVIAYLDPARPQDLRWTTVEYLARTFGFIDLIINLPLNSLMRAILGAYRGGGRGPGAAGRFLNRARPHELVLPSVDRPHMAATIGAIRGHYDEQLMALGFKEPPRRTVNFPADNPYYDILLVSRHERGLELWDKTNPMPVDPQLSFLLGDEGDTADEPD